MTEKFLASSEACACPPEDRRTDWNDCKVHVDCDEWCQAFQRPFGAEETRAAYEHWRYHSYLNGCSHGC